MFQHKISHGYQSVFFAKQFAIFLHEDQTIHIGVNHHAEVAALLLDVTANISKVLCQWFGGMGEVARGLTVQFQNIVNTQGQTVVRGTIDITTASLNLASLDAGVYMIHVNGKNVNFAKKIILK